MRSRRDPLEDAELLLRRVYAYVAYRIGDGAQAEDVTSETFARAVRYRDSYDAGRGRPIDWLLGIARRCLAEAAAVPQSEGDPPDLPGAQDLESETVERLTLADAVARLSDRDRQLIALRYGADLTARGIAEHLGMKTNAVEVALHRALERLSMALEEDPRKGSEGGPVLRVALRPEGDP